MDSPLKDLQFKEGGGDTFIKFETGKAVKLRVYSNNPTISIDNYGNTRYSFVVWDYESGKAKILSKGTSIAKPIAELDSDEDFGADITKQDLKITPTGDGMERRYTITVLPKPNILATEATDSLKELDDKLEQIIKNGIRASDFNNGKQVPAGDPAITDEFKLEDLPEDWQT
jgi:hypothetical protein